MILSFHPLIEKDKNRLCAGRLPNSNDLKAIRAADAVILPQGCSHALYEMARDHCPNVFPNYDARFRYPGKIGQSRLFEAVGVRYPKTYPFSSVSDFFKASDIIKFSYPVVFKFDWGGEGESVHLIQTRDALFKRLKQAEAYQNTGQSGFVIQSYIQTGGRSLRVAAIGGTLISYWRVALNSDEFKNGVSSGGQIVYDRDPELQTAARRAVAQFCRDTRIDLAGFDILFETDDEGNCLGGPLFLEINYFFGRRGIGGSENYYKLIQNAIDNWILSLGL